MRFYSGERKNVKNKGPGSAVEVSIKTLPLLSCAANGGDPLAAVPVAAAWQVIHRAAKLFDDIEDGDADHPTTMIYTDPDEEIVHQAHHQYSPVNEVDLNGGS